MHRRKSSVRREHMITASSSSSDDHNNVSWGADQEDTPMSTHDAAFSSVVPQCRGGVPSCGIHSPASMRRIGRTTFQCKFVSVCI